MSSSEINQIKFRLQALFLALALCFACFTGTACVPDEDLTSDQTASTISAEQLSAETAELEQIEVQNETAEAFKAEEKVSAEARYEAVSYQSSDLSQIPAYSGKTYIELNSGAPSFNVEDFSAGCFETYSRLDSLGRCGVAFAHICPAVMPTEKRGSIGEVKPSGWQIAKYDFIDGKYLYNRCHLIGYQLAGENANPNNLITGTRYLNVKGMLPFENMIDDYVEATGKSVLLRVTPYYEGDDLVAKGVQMEAASVEDRGKSLAFNVFCYNIQPGVVIDYATGDNYADGTAGVASAAVAATAAGANAVADANKYVANKNTKKFHLPSCSSAAKISAKNRLDFSGSRDELVKKGYAPCKQCGP